MKRWALLVVLVGCGGGLTLDEYPGALRDAYCKYLTRCGSFPDVSTCEKANIGIDLHIDPSTKAMVDQGKILFDGGLAQDCLDAFGAQTCDQTDSDGRSFFPTKCRDIVKGTVGSGGACVDNNECKSQMCDVPACTMACCQGTCTGDSVPALGGAGDACTGSSSCAVGFFCDFTATSPVCTELKPAGAACNSTSECAYGFGCAGTTTRTCKTLPKLGEACPDGVCRDAGNYCDAAGQCAKIGLAGTTCGTGQAQCSSYYPCDATTNKCTATPGLGEPCATRCFDANTFCDSSSATPTCTTRRPDGGTCTSNQQCADADCQVGSGAGSGTCMEPAVCI